MALNIQVKKYITYFSNHGSIFRVKKYITFFLNPWEYYWGKEVYHMILKAIALNIQVKKSKMFLEAKLS